MYYRPRFATMNTSHRDHARRLHLNCGLLPMNVNYTRRMNLDVVLGRVASGTSR